MTLKIWSLLELMEYYNVCHLIRLLDALDVRRNSFQSILDTVRHLRDTGELATAHPSWSEEFLSDEMRDSLKPTLSLIKRKCEEADLDTALRRINVRLFLKLRDGITFEQIVSQIQELRHDIESDLEFKRFVFIPTEKAKRLDGLAGRWETVWPKIACEKDVRDAVACHAFGLNTAAVFHAMRVAEIGLRYLAESLGVTISDKKEQIPIEFGDWDGMGDSLEWTPRLRQRVRGTVAVGC